MPIGDDPSYGWEAAAAAFAQRRSAVGRAVIWEWAGHLRPGAAVLDVGCGTGMPVAETLVGQGVAVYGIDPSPTLLAAFRLRLPTAPTACETAENSRFFDRQFDGVVAVGLLFLLPADIQQRIIARIGRVLNPGGRFLFSAPHHECAWADTLTGQPSVSLGETTYRHLLGQAGLRVVGSYVDEGANDYLHAIADDPRVI